MARRGRQRRTEQSKIDATPPWEVRVRDEPPATTGPFDERDAPSDEFVRIDLGALRVPVTEGMDVRLEVNEQQQVVAVTIAGGDSHMQLGVFAAPRAEGIWDEVRAEIAESMNAQRGNAQELSGTSFGVELAGRLPAEAGASVPVRFIGVDGPRWLLRAMLVGPIATDAVKAEPFESVLRKVVVVRGNEPLPAREAVPLQLPKDLAAELGVEAGT